MSMFGHLKAEDFTNLLDGAALDERLQTHLRSCAQCMKTFESVQAVRHQIEEMHSESMEFIPEPDWSEFRSDVRNALLARSVKREHSSRTWLNAFGWQPALAWGLSMIVVVGLIGLIWSRQPTPENLGEAPVFESVLPQDYDLGAIPVMSQTDVFDDLVQLDAEEALNLQMILEDMAREGVSEQ